MARFAYRMQSILNIKVQMESQAKMEFGLASSALAAEEEKLEGMRKSREEYVELGRQLRNEGIDILKIKENEQDVKAMDYLIEGQIEQVKIAQREVERARLKLTQVMQERKAQERLRERAVEE